jgi:hypothetical protein
VAKKKKKKGPAMACDVHIQVEGDTQNRKKCALCQVMIRAKEDAGMGKGLGMHWAV